jgi:uncharacterized phage protein (TIGR02220 family)
MKDNFLLKKSQQEVFNQLTDEEAGKLIKGIFQYATTGENKLDGYLNIIFIPIKNEIDKNEERYKKVCERNKENIEKRWNTKNTTGKSGIPNDTKNTDNHNHIHLENISNSNRSMREEEEKKETFEDTDDSSLLLEISEKVIEHLNKTAGTNFRYTSKLNKSKINARLNEGYVLDDFIDVIDKKHKEWQGTEFERYLCPETLFGNKFEKYLNQKEIVKKEVSTPEWFDKEIKKEELTDEQRELAERLRRGNN